MISGAWNVQGQQDKIIQSCKWKLEYIDTKNKNGRSKENKEWPNQPTLSFPSIPRGSPATAPKT